MVSMTTTMPLTYVDLATRSIADLVEYQDGLMLTRINVPIAQRCQGVGTQLLQRIINDADKYGVTLYLFVSNGGGPNSMTDQRLVKWYKRHGFKTIHRHYMVRRPN